MQVGIDHYDFAEYMTEARWSSLWHQIREVLEADTKNILEIGPGPGTFKAVCRHLGINATTVDIDPHLRPDIVASVFNLPLSDNSYDVTCAFQILEHLPYKGALTAYRELIRVTARRCILSLPDAKRLLSFNGELPKLGRFSVKIPHPQTIFPVPHKFDGEHYWEINKKGYALSKVIRDLCIPGISLIRTYRVPYNNYHRFIVLEKHENFNF
jgi:hypothetical protein